MLNNLDKIIDQGIKEVTQEDVRNEILRIVNDNGGCKTGELIADMDRDFVCLSKGYIIDDINYLVSTGKLIEVEYSLPSMSYRAKSFLLPAGTEVRLIKDGNCLHHMK